MNQLPKCFFGWTASILFALTPGVFFLVFAVVYKPAALIDFLDMGRGLATFNLSILLAIMVTAGTLMRFGFHFFKNAKKYLTFDYIAWCFGEMGVYSLLSALYTTLMSDGEFHYLEALFGHCLPNVLLVMVFPYLILSLSFSLVGLKQEESKDEKEDQSLIRFYDVYHKPKLLIAVSAILYIKAEENYVNIWYMDNGRAVKFSLRAPMNSIEEGCVRRGLVRCQRSYFVNPSHVTILRKENGWIYADLDMEGLPSIPVSKRYYDALSDLL